MAHNANRNRAQIDWSNCSLYTRDLLCKIFLNSNTYVHNRAKATHSSLNTRQIIIILKNDSYCTEYLNVEENLQFTRCSLRSVYFIRFHIPWWEHFGIFFISSTASRLAYGICSLLYSSNFFLLLFVPSGCQYICDSLSC